MINYVIYLIFKLASKFFSILSPETALCIARLLGQLVYVFYPNRKVVAYSNLVSVFGSSKSSYELKRICKKAFINLSQTMIEILRLNKIDKKYITKYIDSVGFQNVEDALLKDKKGAVLLTAHYGNWELLAIVGALKGYPMKVLAREQKPEKINDILNKYRESKGSEVINKGFETRAIIKALRNNQPVGILADQDAGRSGMFVDFLGRPASMPSGPIAFAVKTKAKVLPTFIMRENGPYHKVEMNPAIQFKTKGNKVEVFKSGLNEYSKILSKYIRKYPSQWLWFHKRWKSTPSNSLLILHDAKAGHLNQSKAVGYQIKKIIKQKYPSFPFNINEVEVKFKNKFCRLLTNLCSNFLTGRMIIDINWLKLVLTSECYKKLSKIYTDIILSCGDSLTGLNLIIKKQLNAKNITIMKPSLVKSSNFDIVIVPEHDKIKLSENIIRTKGALNLIDENLMKNSINRIQAEGYRLQNENKKIGVFIGGDTKNYKLSKRIVNNVLDSLLKISDERNLEILLTTSRRTSNGIDALIKNKLKDEERCKLLVIANEKNIPNVVPAILGLSDIVIVSGESISMVSEAASSGKKVLVFEPEERKSRRYHATGIRLKHKKFLEKLSKDGYIVLASANLIKIMVEGILDNKKVNKKLDNIKVIKDAVSKIF